MDWGVPITQVPPGEGRGGGAPPAPPGRGVAAAVRAGAAQGQCWGRSGGFFWGVFSPAEPQFWQVLTASDVVLEVLDARDPQGCRSPRLEGALRPHQRLVLVLNKIGELGFWGGSQRGFWGASPVPAALCVPPTPDLVPRDMVAAWLKHLRAEFPTVAFKACTQQQSRNLVGAGGRGRRGLG